MINDSFRARCAFAHFLAEIVIGGKKFLQILEQQSTMKRKRKLAPLRKKFRLKPEDISGPVSAESPVEDNETSGDDEDEFQGFSDVDEQNELSRTEARAKNSNAAAVESGNNNHNKHSRQRGPTKEELMELEFRASSFQSNLFKLQIDELLSELRVKYEKMRKVETVLHQLKDIIMNIPNTQEQLVSSHSSRLTQATLI